MERIFDRALRGCEVIIGRRLSGKIAEHSVIVAVCFVGDGDATPNVAPLMLVRIAFSKSQGIY